MTLRIEADLLQGSDEWHAQRRGIVTASVVGRLVTPSTIKVASNDTSRGLTALLTAERITGHTDPTYMSDDMFRGVEDEPRAVAVYREHFAPVDTVGFMVRDDWGFSIGYSPDGVVGDDGLIEAKSRRQKEHLSAIVNDRIPPENMAQLQCGLLVSGRAWIDYVSFCAGMRLWVKRVFPDVGWFKAIATAVQAFEEASEQMISAYHAGTEGMPDTERTTMEMVI